MLFEQVEIGDEGLCDLILRLVDETLDELLEVGVDDVERGAGTLGGAHDYQAVVRCDVERPTGELLDGAAGHAETLKQLAHAGTNLLLVLGEEREAVVK